MNIKSIPRSLCVVKLYLLFFTSSWKLENYLYLEKRQLKEKGLCYIREPSDSSPYRATQKPVVVLGWGTPRWDSAPYSGRFPPVLLFCSLWWRVSWLPLSSLGCAHVAHTLRLLPTLFPLITCH